MAPARRTRGKGAAPTELSVGAKLSDALARSKLSQYEIAKRMADARGTLLGSQDQAIRRIRNGQTPSESVARALAAAFAPELNLPDGYFVSDRRLQTENWRTIALTAYEATERLSDEVAELRRLLEQVRRQAGSGSAKGRARSK